MRLSSVDTDKVIKPHRHLPSSSVARRGSRSPHVERTLAWLNRFRSILIRWAKKPANYLALLHFALAIITWRHALPG